MPDSKKEILAVKYGPWLYDHDSSRFSRLVHTHIARQPLHGPTSIRPIWREIYVDVTTEYTDNIFEVIKSNDERPL